MGASGVPGELAAAETEGRPASLQAAWLRLVQTEGAFPQGLDTLGSGKTLCPKTQGNSSPHPRQTYPWVGPGVLQC